MHICLLFKLKSLLSLSGWILWFSNNFKLRNNLLVLTYGCLITPMLMVIWNFTSSVICCACRENLQLLRQRYYYATWKADGTRYMMLITTHGCYLIDRNFCFRRIQMRFPMKNMNEVGTY